MKEQNTKLPMEHPYRRFGIAVVIYVVGVFGFSIWSCFAYYTDIGSDPFSLPDILKNIADEVVLIESLKGLFLLSMPFILIALYHRAKARNTHQMMEINTKLNSDFEKLKKHEGDLEDAIQELERFNAMAMGREQRILELKAEVNTLLQDMNRPKRYNTAPE